MTQLLLPVINDGIGKGKKHSGRVFFTLNFRSTSIHMVQCKSTSSRFTISGLDIYIKEKVKQMNRNGNIFF